MIETGRLILRKWQENDAERLFECAKDPDVGPIAGWPAHKTIDESLDVIRHVFTGRECYAICEKDNNKAIGAVELKLNGHTDMTERDDECELGYWLGKAYWGKGYMPEAAGALIKRGFEELGMTTIWCGYYDGNMKSKRVQEKLGFVYHHTYDQVPVPLFNETRIGHTNVLTKEAWEKKKDYRKRIDTLNEMIKTSKRVVFFGGAGVSTSCGIPDFRSKNGLYNQHDVNFERYSPEYLLSHTCLTREPEVFYEFYRQKLNVKGIEPNITHKKLAKMEAEGKITTVITQNIDGLHQKGGSKHVLEIHGTTLKNYCMRCRKQYPADYIFECNERVPRCECGGMIRPDVVLYEEMLTDEFTVAMDEVLRADMLIVGGTSLVVYPASGLLNYYHGDKLVIINRDATAMDSQCDLVFHEDLDEVFSSVV